MREKIFLRKMEEEIKKIECLRRENYYYYYYFFFFGNPRGTDGLAQLVRIQAASCCY
jgi:hypothetical protein